MLIPAMRPPFSLTVPLSRVETIQRLSDGFAVADCPCQGTTSRGHVSVIVCDQTRKMFSPTLDLEIADGDEQHTALVGRFGPHPNLWTLYIFAYSVLGFATVCGLVYAMAQVTLGDAPWALAVVPIAAAAAAGLYASAFVGQRMAADQMALLETFLIENLHLEAEALRTAR